MTRCLAFFSALCIFLSLTACGNKSKTVSKAAIAEPRNVVEVFFDYFSKPNYETMKAYCTEECVDTYFHKGDVFGMITAKSTNIEEEPKSLSENECAVFVSVEMVTAKSSALYGETETCFFVLLNKTAENTWLINGFATGI